MFFEPQNPFPLSILTLPQWKCPQGEAHDFKNSVFIAVLEGELLVQDFWARWTHLHCQFLLFPNQKCPWGGHDLKNIIFIAVLKGKLPLQSCCGYWIHFHCQFLSSPNQKCPQVVMTLKILFLLLFQKENFQYKVFMPAELIFSVS